MLYFVSEDKCFLTLCPLPVNLKSASLVYFITFTVQIVQAHPLSYLFSVSFMMVDALEENVMKDILSIGLEKKEEERERNQHQNQ